jgi:DNA processing protein
VSSLPQWYDPGDERTALAAWSRLTEPTDARADAFVRREGAAAALGHVLRGGGAGLASAARWRSRLPDLDPRRDLRELAAVRGRLVVPGDEEWPARLDELEVPPFCLWVRGPRRLDAVTARAAAIVGARASTDYGVRVAASFAGECAERGITVVSGAAYGIDAAAHLGALAHGGATVAVLASGVDRPYPRGNAPMLDRIAAEGVVVSEVPPGSAPTRGRFVQRNRVIAALADATLVVEAGLRSGASITAGQAGKLNRPVGVVPGPITSPASAGCHQLLRDGCVCVTSAQELAELVDPFGFTPPGQPALPLTPLDELDPADLRVLDALPVRSSAPVESLARVAGLDVAAIVAGLGRLELGGLAVRAGGGWRRGDAGPG